jgi:hypothetical protein
VKRPHRKKSQSKRSQAYQPGISYKCSIGHHNECGKTNCTCPKCSCRNNVPHTLLTAQPPTS